MTTTIQKLARFITSPDYVLDAQSRATVCDALIDTLGCILVGARQPFIQQIQATLAAWGEGNAPVFGSDMRLSIPWAAMANGAASHAIEFDDWEIPGNTHPSGVLFSAILAVAADRPTSGRAVLDAYVAGFETIARIGEGVNFDHYANGWHATATLGAIGAAASVARLTELDEVQTAHALAISVSQALGYTDQFGSNAKPLHAGFAAKAGVVAAALAGNGLTGQLNILESKKGFAALMGKGSGAAFSAEFITPNPQYPAITQYGLVIKPYPTCGYTHRVLDAVLALRAKHQPDPEQIRRVTASITDFHVAILPFDTPQDRAEALFSVPFCLALALVRGRVTLADIDDHAWQDATVAALMPKVTKIARVPIRPELNYDREDPDWVEVEMADGTIHREAVAFPLGTPQNRMASAQVLQKFLSNAALSVDADQAIIEALQTWDRSADINTVLTPFGKQQ